MANEVKTVITADASGFTSDMLKAEKTTTEFGNSMTKAGSKATTLKGALRQATKEAMDLSLQMSKMSKAELDSDIGRELQAQFQQALQAAGNFKDQMEDVNREIKNIASDTAGWDAAKEGIGVLSSGLQGISGVIGSLGGDVEAFTQALAVMNTVQQVTNTIIGIGNALQSQSALMTGLRAAKNAIFGTTMVAATAAETANTTAVQANTAAKGGNVAATTAATTAQIANNAAVLANPYVAAAVAIAALAAGIVYWISTMDDATDSEIALGAAVDAFSEQVSSAMKEVGEQINLYDDLKRQYDECGGKTDEFSKKLIANTDVQKKLGVTVKTVDDVHKLFAKNTSAYRQAAMARASAMAAEAAQAALLGATLAELSKIQAKLMAGQEVDWRDMRKLVEAMGYSADAADRLMKDAGYVYESDLGGLGYGDIKNGTGDMTKLIEGITKGGAYKALQDMGDQFKATFDTINEIDFGRMLTSNLNALDSTASKAGKSSSKAAKDADDAVKKVLTSLEGCDAIIQQAEKDMKKLDSTSVDYTKKVESLKNTILMARAAKLALIDKSSISGLMEARKLIEQIMQELPEGHPQLEKMRGELKKVDEEIYKMYKDLSESGDLKSMKEARSQLERIIDITPYGTAEWKKWVNEWININGKIKAAEEQLKNWKEGIEEGSKVWLEIEIDKRKSKIKELEKQANPSISVKAELKLEIDDLESQLGRINSLLNGVEVIAPAQKWWEAMDIDFKDYDNEVKRLEGCIDAVKEYLAYAEQIKKVDVSPEKWKELQDGIRLANRQLAQFGKDLVFEKITQQIKEMNSELPKTNYDSVKSGVDSLHTLYNVVTDLPDRLDECKNGFEGFFEVMSAGFSIIDSIVSFIENIKKVIELINGLTAAKGALAMVTQMESAATTGETTELVTNTAATTANAAASTANAGAAIGEAGANTANAATKAASQLSSTGPWGWIAGIAAAAAIAAALFAIIGSAKGYAEGGVVQGSTTVGDRVYARLNAGEMVLNRGQQARLFRLINSGAIGTNSGELSGTIKVTGSDLYLALNNHKKITGKRL